MDAKLFITILTFTFPIFSALVCCAVVFPYSKNTDDEFNLRLRKQLVLYFLTAAMGWFGVLIYPFFPKLFVLLQSFIYISFLLIQILFYYFVFTLTKLDDTEHFSYFHFLLPALITGTLFVWSFFVPFNIQLGIVENKATIIPDGYKAYFYLFSTKTAVRLAFSIVYIALSIIRLLRYRHSILHFSANYERSSLNWLKFLVLISLCFLLMPASSLYFGREGIYNTLSSFFFITLIVMQHIALTYNTLKRNYITIEYTPLSDTYQTEELNTTEVIDDNWLLAKLSVSKLEKYMKTFKPYCNPNLRIIDLAQQMGTNRSYLSSLINETYGMNFSKYINTLRMEELDRIQNDPANAHFSREKQIEMAGFGSYRNYQRFKKSRSLE